MKKFLIALGVIALLTGLAIIFAFAATRALPKEADAFFSLIGKGNFEAAYQSTAEEFRAATDQNVFKGYLEATALDNYQSASWSSRSIQNNVGKLEGTVTTRDGGSIPVVMDLVKEDGGWKVLALKKAPAGLVGDKAVSTVPSDDVLYGLTENAVLLLAEAINAGDFSTFHQKVSKLWKAQSTPESLRDAFAPFIEMQIDLTPLRGETPVFGEVPAVDEDGVLTLEGYYVVEPDPVFFRLKFIYEHPQWQLLGVNVRM